MPKQQALKPHQVRREMRELGFELVRHCNSGHQLWKQIDTGRTITIIHHIGDPRALRNWVRQLTRR